MATQTHKAESALHNLPNQFPPMPAVARILSRFDRDQLHGFITVAIDLADAMEGDPEAEETDLEDSFVLSAWARAFALPGPGCEISDAGGHCDEDGINTNFPSGDGPGCELSDSGGSDLGGH